AGRAATTSARAKSEPGTAGTPAEAEVVPAESPEAKAAATPSERPRPAGTLPPPPASAQSAASDASDEPSAPPPLAQATPKSRREVDVTASRPLPERESAPGPTVQPE